MTGKYHVTVLLVHTGHDVEHLGPGNNRREHGTRSIITSKTNFAHATARNDDERATVLLEHISQDAAHLGPALRREDSVKGIIRAPDNEEREQNPCPQRRFRTPRGDFFFLLFFLVLVGAEEAEERAAFSFSFSSSPPPPPPPATSSSSGSAPGGTGGWCRQWCRHQPSTDHKKRRLGSHVPVRDCPHQRLGLRRETRPLPRSGGFCARRPPFVSCSTPSLALALVWPLEAWCVNSARAIATLCRSCFSHERRRRCLRRRAAHSPSTLPPAIILTIRWRQKKVVTPLLCDLDCSCSGGGSGGADMTRTTRCFFHNAACVHRVSGRTPGSQTPGVSATLALDVRLDAP